MRSYQAARSLFSLLSVLSWCVIILGGIAAFVGGAAVAEMVRYGQQPFGILVAAIPGLILVLMGFFGLVFAQMGRAGVDTAEYSQQALQISRDQLEVSRQALRHGEDVKTGFASLKTLLTPQTTATYADLTSGAAKPSYGADRLQADAGVPQTIEYKGQKIQVQGQGYYFASTFFTTLEAAHSYVDGLSMSAKPALSATR